MTSEERQACWDPDGESGCARARQEGEWVKLNAGQLGAFRVAYAPELWARLAAAAAAPARPGGAPALAPADLAGLLDDAWALAEAGAAPIAAFLNLTRSVSVPCCPDPNP